MSWKSFTYGHAIQYTDYPVGKSCTYWHPNQYIDYHVVKKLHLLTREPIHRLPCREKASPTDTRTNISITMSWKSFTYWHTNQYIDYHVVKKLHLLTHEPIYRLPCREKAAPTDTRTNISITMSWKSFTYWHANQYIDYHVVKKLHLLTLEPIYRLPCREKASPTYTRTNISITMSWKSFTYWHTNQYIDYHVVKKLHLLTHEPIYRLPCREKASPTYTRTNISITMSWKSLPTDTRSKIPITLWWKNLAYGHANRYIDFTVVKKASTTDSRTNISITLSWQSFANHKPKPKLNHKNIHQGRTLFLLKRLQSHVTKTINAPSELVQCQMYKQIVILWCHVSFTMRWWTFI